jgi:hypothetical protein
LVYFPNPDLNPDLILRAALAFFSLGWTNALSANLLHGFGRFILSNERPTPVRYCNASEGYDGHRGKQQTNVSTYMLDIGVLVARKTLMPVRGMRGSLRAFHHVRPTSLSRRLSFHRLNGPDPWRRFADTTRQHWYEPVIVITAEKKIAFALTHDLRRA